MDGSTAGVALLVASVVLISLEAFLPTGGLVGALGIAAFVVAGVLLEIPVVLIVAISLLVAALGLFVGQRVFRAQRQKRVMTGWEELMGAIGEVRVSPHPVGQVFVEGALWTARVAEGTPPLERGAKVRITGVEGLTLEVEPIDPGESGAASDVESPT